MDWIEISVAADGEAAESVTELFNRLNSRPDGQGGAVTEVAGFDPIGEAHRPTITVRTYLPSDAADTPDKRQRIEEGLWFLGRIYPVAEPQVRVLAEEDWANAWKAHYKPLRVGRRFLVVPAWMWGKEEAGPIADSDLPLVLDPGMAFGTGLHPSTQLCLTSMEDAVRPGDRVLDAGCGSGVLSLAAARLGAGEVQAFDIDEIAVAATAQNAALNDMPIPIHVFQSTGPDDGPFWAPPGGFPPQFDVILVNILVHVIIGLLDRGLGRFLAAPGHTPAGRMILAGVIAEQEPQLVESLARHGLAAARKLEQGDWVAFIVESKP